ncbi:MAG: hypothetical protein Q9M50_10830 [Methylococcales bacterium]|nr:hypothetical protein [Methylococcales bacterium]
MSGEAVVVSTISAGTVGAVLAFGGLMALGSLAYKMAKTHQEQRFFDAQKKAFEQKKKLTAWQDYQMNQQKSMEALNEKRQIALDAFENLHLNLEMPEVKSQKNDNTPELGAQAQVFLDTDEHSQVEQHLAKLERWLFALPAKLSEHESSLIPQLKTQFDQLKTQSPRLETVESFIATAKLSVSQLMTRLDKQQQQQAQVLQQAEQQLDVLLNYQHFAESEIETEEIAALQAHLLTILEQKGRSTHLSALSLLAKKSAHLKQGIDERLEQQATEATVYKRIHHHMESMGYRAIRQQGEPIQSWEIPGGEQVRFSLQPDFKLGFQVAHERTQHSDAALSLPETAFLHQQEAKWCNDLPKLLMQLQKDGLNYRVDFERQLPDDGIPIVILETVDDLLAAEDERTHSQQNAVKRYLDQ